MPQQTLAQKSVYWLKVISLGLILGFGIQFAEAWTSPDPLIAPPGGNVSGPITTSGVAQTKDGALTVNAPLKSTKGGALNMGTLILGTTNLDGWSGKWLVLGDGSSGTEGWRNTNFQAGLVYAQTLCIMNDCRVAWPAGGGGGVADNLGNHTATTTLNLAGQSIDGFSNLKFGDRSSGNVGISLQGGWVHVDNSSYYDGGGLQTARVLGRVQVNSPKFCLSNQEDPNATSCITSWPTGGGGNVSKQNGCVWENVPPANGIRICTSGRYLAGFEHGINTFAITRIYCCSPTI